MEFAQAALRSAGHVAAALIHAVQTSTVLESCLPTSTAWGGLDACLAAVSRSPLETAALVGGTVTVAVVGGAVLCRRRPKPKHKRSHAAGTKQAATAAPVTTIKASKDGDTAVFCQACSVLLPAPPSPDEDVVHRHKQGKKHAKKVEELQREGKAVSDAAVFTLRKLPKPAPKSEQQPAAVTDSRSEAAADPVRLVGSNMAVVWAQPGVSSAGGHNDAWTTVSKAGSSGSGASGSSSGILRGLMYMEGGRNVLEGLALVPKFVSGLAPETKLIQFVDAALDSARQGRLRRDTFRPARGAVGAQLHYGCVVDYEGGGSAVSGKTVEPIPPPLAELARRITSRPELWGPQRKPVPLEVATVHILEPGMSVPPHRIGADFARPAFVLVLGAAEDVLLGSRIEPIAGAPGEYTAGFALQPHRRGLLCLDGAAADIAQLCVPAVRNRMIVIMLRAPTPGLRAELQARGNIM